MAAGAYRVDTLVMFGFGASTVLRVPLSRKFLDFIFLC